MELGLWLFARLYKGKRQADRGICSVYNTIVNVTSDLRNI